MNFILPIRLCEKWIKLLTDVPTLSFRECEYMLRFASLFLESLVLTTLRRFYRLWALPISGTFQSESTLRREKIEYILYFLVRFSCSFQFSLLLQLGTSTQWWTQVWWNRGILVFNAYLNGLIWFHVFLRVTLIIYFFKDGKCSNCEDGTLAREKEIKTGDSGLHHA